MNEDITWTPTNTFTVSQADNSRKDFFKAIDKFVYQRFTTNEERKAYHKCLTDLAIKAENQEDKLLLLNLLAKVINY